jgi:hypothetical protein
MSLHGGLKLFNQSFLLSSSYDAIRVIRNSLFINSLPEPGYKALSVRSTLSAYGVYSRARNIRVPSQQVAPSVKARDLL